MIKQSRQRGQGGAKFYIPETLKKHYFHVSWYPFISTFSKQYEQVIYRIKQRNKDADLVLILFVLLFTPIYFA